MSEVLNWGEWEKMIRELPPRPLCFMAHHAVPYGGVFRQWTTLGELIVWVNRGEIEDIPRRRPRPYAIAPNGIDTEMLLSIPIVMCEAADSQERSTP